MASQQSLIAIAIGDLLENNVTGETLLIATEEDQQTFVEKMVAESLTRKRHNCSKYFNPTAGLGKWKVVSKNADICRNDQRETLLSSSVEESDLSFKHCWECSRQKTIENDKEIPPKELEKIQKFSDILIRKGIKRSGIPNTKVPMSSSIIVSVMENLKSQSPGILENKIVKDVISRKMLRYQKGNSSECSKRYKREKKPGPTYCMLAKRDKDCFILSAANYKENLETIDKCLSDLNMIGEGVASKFKSMSVTGRYLEVVVCVTHFIFKFINTLKACINFHNREEFEARCMVDWLLLPLFGVFQYANVEINKTEDWVNAQKEFFAVIGDTLKLIHDLVLLKLFVVSNSCHTDLELLLYARVCPKSELPDIYAKKDSLLKLFVDLQLEKYTLKKPSVEVFRSVEAKKVFLHHIGGYIPEEVMNILNQSPDVIKDNIEKAIDLVKYKADGYGRGVVENRISGSSDSENSLLNNEQISQNVSHYNEQSLDNNLVTENVTNNNGVLVDNEHLTKNVTYNNEIEDGVCSVDAAQKSVTHCVKEERLDSDIKSRDSRFLLKSPAVLSQKMIGNKRHMGNSWKKSRQILKENNFYAEEFSLKSGNRRSAQKQDRLMTLSNLTEEVQINSPDSDKVKLKEYEMEHCKHENRNGDDTDCTEDIETLCARQPNENIRQLTGDMKLCTEKEIKPSYEKPLETKKVISCFDEKDTMKINTDGNCELTEKSAFGKTQKRKNPVESEACDVKRQKVTADTGCSRDKGSGKEEKKRFLRKSYLFLSTEKCLPHTHIVLKDKDTGKLKIVSKEMFSSTVRPLSKLPKVMTDRTTENPDDESTNTTDSYTDESKAAYFVGSRLQMTQFNIEAKNNIIDVIEDGKKKHYYIATIKKDTNYTDSSPTSLETKMQQAESSSSFHHNTTTSTGLMSSASLISKHLEANSTQRVIEGIGSERVLKTKQTVIPVSLIASFPNQAQLMAASAFNLTGQQLQLKTFQHPSVSTQLSTVSKHPVVSNTKQFTDPLKRMDSCQQPLISTLPSTCTPHQPMPIITYFSRPLLSNDGQINISSLLPGSVIKPIAVLVRPENSQFGHTGPGTNAKPISSILNASANISVKNTHLQKGSTSTCLGSSLLTSLPGYTSTPMQFDSSLTNRAPVTCTSAMGEFASTQTSSIQKILAPVQNISTDLSLSLQSTPNQTTTANIKSEYPQTASAPTQCTWNVQKSFVNFVETSTPNQNIIAQCTSGKVRDTSVCNRFTSSQYTRSQNISTLAQYTNAYNASSCTRYASILPKPFTYSASRSTATRHFSPNVKTQVNISRYLKPQSDSELFHDKNLSSLPGKCSTALSKSKSKGQTNINAVINCGVKVEGTANTIPTMPSSDVTFRQQLFHVKRTETEIANQIKKEPVDTVPETALEQNEPVVEPKSEEITEGPSDEKILQDVRTLPEMKNKHISGNEDLSEEYPTGVGVHVPVSLFPNLASNQSVINSLGLGNGKSSEERFILLPDKGGQGFRYRPILIKPTKISTTAVTSTLAVSSEPMISASATSKNVDTVSFNNEQPNNTSGHCVPASDEVLSLSFKKEVEAAKASFKLAVRNEAMVKKTSVQDDFWNNLQQTRFLSSEDWEYKMLSSQTIERICKVCGAAEHNVDGQLLHALTHKYICILCGMEFSHQSEFQWHFLAFHKSSLFDEKVRGMSVSRTCRMCGNTQRAEPNGPLNICKCSRPSKERILSQGLSLETGNQRSPLHCENCKDVFWYQNTLFYHYIKSVECGRKAVDIDIEQGNSHCHKATQARVFKRVILDQLKKKRQDLLKEKFKTQEKINYKIK